MDIQLSLILIVGLSWMYVCIVCVYFLIREYPILFRQRRIGRFENEFNLYKFRTLSIDGSKTLKDRRFEWGDFLRRTSLDELPQLWNVLRGEMSFIGPRPLPTAYLSRFKSHHKKRHLVKPGITGWAQVNGRNSISWEKKFELDIYYVDHISFWLDIKILFKTVVVLFSFRKDVSLDEPEFLG